MKNCSAGSPCQYRVQDGSMLMCNYQGYCDFQLPRDSGGWNIQQIPTQPEETCEYCHLPLRKCKGHNIC